MKKWIVTLILVLLIVISLVQAFQINALDGKSVASPDSSLQSSPSGQSSGGVALPSNLQNLPDMVGGC